MLGVRRHHCLALLCEVPPRARFLAVRLRNDGHEHIDHAWVVQTTREPAKFAPQHKRVAWLQLCKLRDAVYAKQFEITQRGWANICHVRQRKRQRD